MNGKQEVDTMIESGKPKNLRQGSHGSNKEKQEGN
jgi:hypothetical protein